MPSLRRPELVPDFASRLAQSLGLACADVVVKVRHTEPQKTMQNSQQQYRNIWDAFEIRVKYRRVQCCLWTTWSTLAGP